MHLNKMFSLFFLLVSFLGMSITNTTFAQSDEVDSEKVAPYTAMVDINTALLDELLSLKGIGRKRAEALIEERNANGKFNSMDELSRVKGFSKKRIARILAENEGRIQVRK